MLHVLWRDSHGKGGQRQAVSRRRCDAACRGPAYADILTNLTNEDPMHTHTLKDARYRTIGYIETAADGKQTGKDERFRTVGHGNLLASLITCR